MLLGHLLEMEWLKERNGMHQNEPNGKRNIMARTKKPIPQQFRANASVFRLSKDNSDNFIL